VWSKGRGLGGGGLGGWAGDGLHETYRFGKGISGYSDSSGKDGTQNCGWGLSLNGRKGGIQIGGDDPPLASRGPGNPFKPAE